MITAVLERHAQIRVNQSDIYMNVVGGLKITEPAADLAIAAAIISSEKDKPIDMKSCFFGELGLTGEIRGVLMPEIRVKEAIKLGFKNFYLPAGQKSQIEAKKDKDLNFYFLNHIRELNNVI